MFFCKRHLAFSFLFSGFGFLDFLVLSARGLQVVGQVADFLTCWATKTRGSESPPLLLFVSEAVSLNSFLSQCMFLLL